MWWLLVYSYVYGVDVGWYHIIRDPDTGTNQKLSGSLPRYKISGKLPNRRTAYYPIQTNRESFHWSNSIQTDEEHRRRGHRMNSIFKKTGGFYTKFSITSPEFLIFVKISACRSYWSFSHQVGYCLWYNMSCINFTFSYNWDLHLWLYFQDLHIVRSVSLLYLFINLTNEMRIQFVLFSSSALFWMCAAMCALKVFVISWWMWHQRHTHINKSKTEKQNWKSIQKVTIN